MRGPDGQAFPGQVAAEISGGRHIAMTNTATANKNAVLSKKDLEKGINDITSISHYCGKMLHSKGYPRV